MDKISAKWARAASTATPEYLEGVQNPRKDWSTETQKSAPAYKAGITKSLQNDSFKKGVARAGTSKWQTNALSKGVDRWAAGIAGSQPAYEEGFAPYAQIISRIQLPPRGPKGDPNNIQRVAIIAKALNDEKVKRS